MTTEELNKMGHSLAYESCVTLIDGMATENDGLGMIIVESDLEPYEWIAR